MKGLTLGLITLSCLLTSSLVSGKTFNSLPLHLPSVTRDDLHSLTGLFIVLDAQREAMSDILTVNYIGLYLKLNDSEVHQKLKTFH